MPHAIKREGYADKIRSDYARHGGGAFSLNCLREVANSKEGVITATAELGKLGIQLKDIDAIEDPKAERAELRRAINALLNHARSKPENLTDSVLDAVECLSSRVEIIDHQERMDQTAEDNMAGGRAAAGGESDGTLRDQEGKRIGVLLPNATLRDAGAVAKRLGHDRQAFDGKERGDLSAFFRGIAGGRTTEAIQASLSEGTDSQGGYAVPTWLLPGILSALVPASSMLQAGANVAVLQQPGDSFKIAAVDTVPTAGWRAENGSLDESDPAFRAVTITPRSLAFIFKVSRELLMDAPGMEQALRIAIAAAFAKEIDRAGLIGTGTAPEIQGILDTTGVNVYDMGSTAGGELKDYSSIIKARTLIANDNAPAPTAIITSTREAETIDLFADTTGQPLRRPPALEAMKFVSTSQVPINDTHGSATDASTMYLGDFGMATFYMREALSIQKLNELYAANGQIGFACHARVDLALAYPKAFCTIKGVVPAA
jgi:HK97 family phage major capsid protein